MLRIAAAALGIVVLIAAATFAARELTDSDKDAKASGPAPQTTKKLMWGLSFLPDGSSTFPTMEDLGVGIFAIQARWEMVAPDRRPADPTDPKDPAYEWPEYLTGSIKEAQQHGMKVQLMLMGAPKWANGGKPWNWIPEDPDDFGDFATAVSRRYPSVDLWMIWGEPNRQPNFSPLTPMTVEQATPDYELNAEQQAAPRSYAVLLDTAYEALKREGPSDLVVGGNTYTSAGTDNIRPYQWAEYMTLPDGSRPRMDMWGHNPWGNRRPGLESPSRNGTVSFPDLERLVEVIDGAGFPGEPLDLYLSEWGVATGFEDKDLLQKLSDKAADKWIREAFEIAEWDRIYTLGWVHLLDNERNSTGLLTEDGQRKSTYETYKRSG